MQPDPASLLPKTVNLPTLFFIRLPLPFRMRHKGAFLFLLYDLFLALLPTRFVLLIQQCGLAGRTPLFVDAGYGDIPTVLVLMNRQSVADFDVSGRFAALAIMMNLAAGDRVGGEPARLKKTRGPQPFIDA